MPRTITGFHHVKLPVSDIARSRDWYTRVLGLEVRLEFVEEGTLMGLALADRGDTVQLALRVAPDRTQALAGFDPVALAVTSPAAVHTWATWLDEHDEPHGGVVTGAEGGAVLVGLRDPDGIEIRLYADPPEDQP